MTSGLQPTGAGAPQPVLGVTGGPGINQGTASVDPGSGALILHPQPANVVQVRGSTPGAFQVYEYFHTNTDFARLTLAAQINGPFLIDTETAPNTVIRGLTIQTNGLMTLGASGGVFINASATVNNDLIVGGNVTVDGGIVNSGSNTLNLTGPSAGPLLGIVFTIGSTQPWGFSSSFAFTPTANISYDIGSTGSFVRQMFLGQLKLGVAAAPLAGVVNIGSNTVAPGTGTHVLDWQIFVGVTEYRVPLYTPT